MSVIFIVVPIAILVALAAVLAYTWAARRGQFDDLVTPAMRILNDDVEEGRSERRRERMGPGGVGGADSETGSHAPGAPPADR